MAAASFIRVHHCLEHVLDAKVASALGVNSAQLAPKTSAALAFDEGSGAVTRFTLKKWRRPTLLDKLLERVYLNDRAALLWGRKDDQMHFRGR